MWIDNIISYLQDGTLPTDKLQDRCIQHRPAKFCLLNRILYKRIHAEGNSWRRLRESFWGEIIGEKGSSSGLFLVPNGTWCINIHQEVWQMSEVCSNKSSPSHWDGAYDQPMIVCSVGNRHSRTSASSSITKKILDSLHWLCHKVDKSRASRQDHRKEHQEFHMEEHRLLIWNSKGYHLR